MKTVDYEFHKLCEEIDYWKQEAEYYKELYEKMLRSEREASNKALEESKRGVANALMFALSVKDNADGSLSISPEDREKLAKSYK